MAIETLNFNPEHLMGVTVWMTPPKPNIVKVKVKAFFRYMKNYFNEIINNLKITFKEILNV